ncbi:MAG: hypothetical protein Q9164_006284 [Protoblastenia rupestris]
MKPFTQLDNELTWLPQLKLEVFPGSGKARKITARRRFLRALCRRNNPAYPPIVEESGTEAVTLEEKTDEDGVAQYANRKGPFTSSEICCVHQAMQSLWVDKVIPSLNVIQMAAEQRRQAMYTVPCICTYSWLRSLSDGVGFNDEIREEREAPVDEEEARRVKKAEQHAKE